MASEVSVGTRSAARDGRAPAIWLAAIALVYLLLVGVATIGAGFKWASGGAEGAAAIFSFARNPIVGVILGTLATALVQSSSTVTSVIVGLVAGGVPVGIAVPMIMGANMGTTITNTIVSFGNLRERTAFRKSFEAATVHDFFNLYSILIFLPLEIAFHPLEKAGAVLAQFMAGGAQASIGGLNIMASLTKPAASAVMRLAALLPEAAGALCTIALGIGMVIVAVIYLGKVLRSVMTGKARGIVDKAIGRGPASGIASGTVATILVQSSSTTTSLVVPLAGKFILSRLGPTSAPASPLCWPLRPAPAPASSLRYRSPWCTCCTTCWASRCSYSSRFCANYPCAPASGWARWSSVIAAVLSGTSGRCFSCCREWSLPRRYFFRPRRPPLALLGLSATPGLRIVSGAIRCLV